MTELKQGDRVRVSYETTIADNPWIGEGEVGVVRQVAHGGTTRVRKEHVTLIQSVADVDPIGTVRLGCYWGKWIKTYAGWALIDRERRSGGTEVFSGDSYNLMLDSDFSAMDTTPEES